MNSIQLILLLFCCLNLQAQEQKLLISKKLVSDLSQTPIYPRLIEQVDGEEKWKNAYRYLDDIDIYGIEYLSGDLRIKGLLVKPKKKGKYPCVIYNRGGVREVGALKIAHGALILGRLAKEGYIVIASQYRGNSGSGGKDEFGGSDINDVLILTEVLKEIEGADMERIGMYGWSRGGMMTYMALTKTHKIRAAVVGGALSDCFEIIKDRPEMRIDILAKLIPDFEINKQEELEKRSAVKWAEKFPNDVPILMLHGNADWRVKPQQSLKMALEFEKYRKPYRLIIFEGGDHSISEHKGEVNEQVVRWFDKYLKQDAPLPNMEYHGR